MEATITDLYYNSQRQLKAKTDVVTDEELLLEYRRTGDRDRGRRRWRRRIGRGRRLVWGRIRGRKLRAG